MSTLDVISDHGRLRDMSEEWDAALLRNGAQDFSLTSHWLTNFLTSFDFGDGVRVLCVRDTDGAIIGQAAFLLTRSKGLPFLSSLTNVVGNRSSLVGTTEGLAEIASWINNQAVAGFRLGRNFPEPQLLEHLPSLRTGQEFQLPVIATDQSFEDYIASRSSNFKRSLKRARSKSKAKGMRMDEMTAPTDQDIEMMMKVSEKTWTYDAGTAIVSDPQTRSLFTGLARPNASQTAVKPLLFLLRDEADDPIGFSFCISFNKVLYGLKMGYDPAVSDVSPGFLLMDVAMQHATQASDIDLFDLDAVGGHGDYKFRWATELLALETSIGFPPSYLGSLGKAVWTARDAVRRGKQKSIEKLGNSKT